MVESADDTAAPMAERHSRLFRANGLLRRYEHAERLLDPMPRARG